ncbi:MAG: hypothetical protein PHU25_13600 [Deltaproteobacteria bacterium]|nr:hypothetical protein [Deltaproteobacteria bacterium]
MTDTIIKALWTALGATAVQLLVLLGTLLALVAILTLTSNLVCRLAVEVVGRRPYLWLFGWLGAAVHEVSHAALCVLFGHRITEMRVFEPDPATGRLGYVRHAFSPRNPYHLIGNFFIATGPVVAGSAVIALAAWLLLGPGGDTAPRSVPFGTVENGALSEAGRLLGHLGAGVSRLGEMIGNVGQRTWYVNAAFLWIAFSVGGLMALSPADLKGAIHGLVAIAVMVYLANVIALVAAGAPLTRYAWDASRHMGFGYSMMALAAVLNAAMALALGLLVLPVRVLKVLFGPAPQVHPADGSRPPAKPGEG